MTDLNEMWQELARYQTYADKHGFGAEWKHMCEERTERAAAMAAAWAEEAAAWKAARGAAWKTAVVAARDAAWAVRAARDAARAAAIASRYAIENIRKAIELEQEKAHDF